MSTSYSPLNNAATNLKALLEEQNADGVYAAKLNGWEPFEVLAAKTIYNAYADVQAAIAADVEGPATSTDNALVRFDGTTGKLIQNSNAILTDAGALSIPSNLTVSGTEPTASLSSTAASSIGYQLISGGNLGHTLGTFKIYDATTGYTVFSHAKPTSGPNVRMSFDAAGAATFGGNLTVSGTGTNVFNASSVATPRDRKSTRLNSSHRT